MSPSLSTVIPVIVDPLLNSLVVWPFDDMLLMIACNRCSFFVKSVTWWIDDKLPQEIGLQTPTPWDRFDGESEDYRQPFWGFLRTTNYESWPLKKNTSSKRKNFAWQVKLKTLFTLNCQPFWDLPIIHCWHGALTFFWHHVVNLTGFTHRSLMVNTGLIRRKQLFMSYSANLTIRPFAFNVIARYTTKIKRPIYGLVSSRYLRERLQWVF